MFVGPSGSRAASAGFLITIAADIAAMAPGTHIGAAHPVQGGGEKLDETMAKKMASDVAAAARTWATGRGRNAQLADEAVRESRSFTESEALDAAPPLIDLVVARRARPAREARRPHGHALRRPDRRAQDRRRARRRRSR